MVFSQKLFLIDFISIKGNTFHLAGTPDVFGQGNDDAHTGIFHRAAMIQHGIILLFVGFVPRNVPLCRKERRQEAANVRSFSCRISKTQCGEVVFRRYIDGATLIR